MKHTLYSEAQEDGQISRSSITCLDCIIEGKTEMDADWEKLNNQDPVECCRICGGQPAPILDPNKPMLDFIESISNGTYLKGNK